MTPGVIRDINERIENETRDLRKSKDWPDFVRRNGIITGLELVLGMVKERAKNPQTDGDDTHAD